ncbi:trypsin-like peptidase domain-containing protein [Paenibacillus cremeus]|uniref:Trypsin-like peptidase domain-containing protein n=2 Tax=Paenibacillus cremeus TaxID=2163881 RepID=A0A559K5K3_9BACL|nr:trypsin-like peptidase domain-containing protein [Paenibacillus cremeus]
MIGILLLGWFSLPFQGQENAVKADQPTTYNAEEIYDQLEDAVFYIRALNADDSLKAAGTGVVISPEGLAATAYHVIDGAEKLEAIFNDGRVVAPIEVVGTDEGTDAAVLKLPELKSATGGAALYHALPVRETAVKHGEKVFAIGYPMKNTPIITEGIVNSPKAEINGRDRILTSAQVVSGMSGGPLIDQLGRLSGIISGSLRTMNNIHLIIDMKDIRSLLQQPY